MSDWKKTKCCGTCALWDIEAAKTRSGAVRADAHVRCGWVSTELYPVSVWPRNNRPEARFTGRDSGDDCPCYVQRGSVNIATIIAKHRFAQATKEK